jgi:hypothetical protein
MARGPARRLPFIQNCVFADNTIGRAIDAGEAEPPPVMVCAVRELHLHRQHRCGRSAIRTRGAVSPRIRDLS